MSQAIVQGNVNGEASPQAAKKSDDLKEARGGDFPVLGGGACANKNAKRISKDNRGSEVSVARIGSPIPNV